MHQLCRSLDDKRRTTGVTRSVTLYDNRSPGIRRPIASETQKRSEETKRAMPSTVRQPETHPTTNPVLQPETQPIPKSETTRQSESREISKPVETPVPQTESQPNPKPEIPRIVTRTVNNKRIMSMQLQMATLCEALLKVGSNVIRIHGRKRTRHRRNRK